MIDVSRLSLATALISSFKANIRQVAPRCPYTHYTWPYARKTPPKQSKGCLITPASPRCQQGALRRFHGPKSLHRRRRGVRWSFLSAAEDRATKTEDQATKLPGGGLLGRSKPTPVTRKGATPKRCPPQAENETQLGSSDRVETGWVCHGCGLANDAKIGLKNHRCRQGFLGQTAPYYEQ